MNVLFPQACYNLAMKKITVGVLILIIVGTIGYVATLPKGGEEPEPDENILERYSWTFTEIGEDEITKAPRTQVTLTIGTTSYPAGTYSGSCTGIEGSSWQLRENEKSGVICWFGGGGNEIGIFEENDRLVVKLGDLDEGDSETQPFRGNYRTLFEIGPDARIFTIYARIDQGASALGVKVIPLKVLEDSRCPVDAVCAQAGTVRLTARIESPSTTGGAASSSDVTIELGKTATTETERITLTAVEPTAMTGKKIKSAEYRFTFRIEKLDNSNVAQ